MAKKKEPSIIDDLNYFKEIIGRLSATSLEYNNRTIIISTKNGSVGMKVEQDLWNAIIEDGDIKLTEIDPTDKENLTKISIIESEDDWIELNSDDIYSGTIIHISVPDTEYNISITKEVIPIRLKKAENNDISYQVISISALNNSKILKVRKHFKGSMDNASFDLISMFLIA